MVDGLVVPATEDQDRVAWFETADGVVLVVADGAGGTGGGTVAAEAVVRAVGAAVAAERLNDWLEVLSEVDADLAGAGQTTVVVAELCAIVLCRRRDGSRWPVQNAPASPKKALSWPTAIRGVTVAAGEGSSDRPLARKAASMMPAAA